MPEKKTNKKEIGNTAYLVTFKKRLTPHQALQLKRALKCAVITVVDEAVMNQVNVQPKVNDWMLRKLQPETRPPLKKK